MDRTVSDIGEMRVIQLFKAIFPRGKHLLEAYDDAWSFRSPGYYVTVSTDMLVAKTDVPPSMTIGQAARKIIVMGASDIASKGHRPSFYLLSLGLRADMKLSALHQAMEGVRMGVKENGGELVAGDTNEAEDFIANITTVGIGKNRPVPRKFGKVGDIIATTGRFGGPPAGLSVLLGRAKKPERGWQRILDSVVMPRAQVLAGTLLAEAGVLSGSTDSSDGLSTSLHNMSVNSEYGALIEKIPVLEGVEEFAALNQLNAIDLALNGGEEYHLVLSVKKERWEEAILLSKRNRFDLFRIGEVISRHGTWRKGEGGILLRIEPKGWEHFRKAFYEGTGPDS